MFQHYKIWLLMIWLWILVATFCVFFFSKANLKCKFIIIIIIIPNAINMINKQWNAWRSNTHATCFHFLYKHVVLVDPLLGTDYIIRWTTVTFCTDSYSPQRINPNGFGDSPAHKQVNVFTYSVDYFNIYLMDLHAAWIYKFVDAVLHRKCILKTFVITRFFL